MAFAGYTKTTDRTGRVIPVAVIVVVAVPVAAAWARACLGGRKLRALAQSIDMGTKRTRSPRPVSSAAAPHAGESFRCKRNS